MPRSGLGTALLVLGLVGFAGLAADALARGLGAFTVPFIAVPGPASQAQYYVYQLLRYAWEALTDPRVVAFLLAAGLVDDILSGRE